MMRLKQFRRGVGALAVGAGMALLGGCNAVDQLLEVSNPAQLQEDQVNDPAMVDILVNSVQGAMTAALDDPFIWVGSMPTDMQVTGINWEDYARVSQRIMNFTEGPPDAMFSALSRLRAMADSVAGRFRNGLLENASSDWRMAFALAYAGYGYVFLADAMCEATIDVGETVYEPLDLYAFAVERFQEALQVAGAAGDTDLQNLARVGLARAHLNLGNYSDVVAIASQVPEDFKWWVEYAPEDNQDAPGNTLWSRTQGTNHSLGVHPNFLAGGPDNWLKNDLEPFLTDPRVQHFPYWRHGHNQLSPLYTPYQGLRLSGYNGQTIASGGQPAPYTRGMDILLADGLEARHHYWEAVDAMGSDPAGVLAFVNERRAYGNQPPVSLSGQALTMELRQQRGKDLFLGGFRLGDLRRWLRNGTDMFPSGLHPVHEWGQYGTWTCFPLPVEEYEGNPHINKPGG